MSMPAFTAQMIIRTLAYSYNGKNVIPVHNAKYGVTRHLLSDCRRCTCKLLSAASNGVPYKHVANWRGADVALIIYIVT
jgi:hypothetical protein